MANKKDGEKLFWGLVGLLTLAAGIAHVAPSFIAGVVAMSLFGLVTVQQIAGLAAILLGVMSLNKTFKKKD